MALNIMALNLPNFSIGGGGEWLLFYVVAFCTIMAISRQTEAQSRDYVLLLSNYINGSL